MIIVQGCSFSQGASLQQPSKYRYATFLQKKLDTQVLSWAEPSKDNFTMYFELHTYLNYLQAKKVEKPEIIIWQLSDTFRKGLVDWHASGSWEPGNINSLIGDYHRRHIKTIYWSGYNRIKKRYKELYKEDPKKAKLYKNRVGMGSKIFTEKDPFLIGDETFIHNELYIGLHINTIQNLCKQLGVRLIIVNYYGTPKNVLKDPIMQNIDRKDYLIKNSEQWGLYNHLMWRGFDRPDEYHFNVDGHYYQADILYDFIVHNKRITVEEEAHMDVTNFPVFDYTHHELEAKKFLIKYATTGEP